MNRYKFGVLILLWTAACSEPVDNPTCSLNSDCKSGYLCKDDGTCIKAETVSIRPIVLDDAMVGDSSYTQALQADDGIKPYTWSMTTEDSELAWLEIDTGTGELRTKSGQAPTEVGLDLQIEVTVRDRSNGGEGETATRPFGLSVVECRGPAACYEADQDKCMEGEKACVDGVLTGECGSKAPSTDANHCGPGCGPCAPTGDRCEAGECRCGSRDPCTAEEACCGGTGCYDLTSDTTHCGDCGVDCGTQAGHATGVFCDQSECDYVTCDIEYMDCDANRANGCETYRDRNNCSTCGDDCTNTDQYPHTVNQSCPTGVCEYTCEDGYADCDTQLAGCETQLGTELNCGHCGQECISPAAPVCITTTGEETRCGCTTENDCAADRMCCATHQTCIIHSPQNCESCSHMCTIEQGGLECLGDAGTGWECGCTAHDSCKGIYSFSVASCRSDIDQCTCLGNTNCAGTADEICCSTAGVPGCVDLDTDANNCGMCDRICGSGKSCSAGACGCSAVVSCPNLAGEAWQCSINEVCVCTDISGTLDADPCHPGQYCCQNKGCCTKECSVADEATDCSEGCFDADPSNVWCNWGCCESCADEGECGLYEPEGFPFYP